MPITIGFVPYPPGQGTAKKSINNAPRVEPPQENSLQKKLTIALQAVPTLPLSVNISALTASGITVTWTGIATSFIVTVYSSVSSLMTSPTQVIQSTVSSSGQTISFSPTDSLYYGVSVQARNQNGLSKITSLTAGSLYTSPPVAPTSITLSSLTGTGATVTWSGGSGATSYRCQIYSSASSNMSSPSTVSQTPLSSTTVTSPQAFTFTATGGLYYGAIITAVNAGGSTASSISTGFLYTVPPVAPTSVSLSSLTGTGATVTWSGGSGATSYTCQIYSSASSNMSSPSTVSQTPLSSTTVTSPQAFTFTATGALYYGAIVTAVNAGGSTASSMSTGVLYTAPLVLPAAPYWLAGGTANSSPTAVLGYSSDRGVSWTQIPLSFNGTVYCIAYNGSNLFVMGGTFSPALYTSTDGITWTANNQTILTNVYSIVYATNLSRWVAVGAGSANYIMYSGDGINWTGAGSIMNLQILGVAYNGTNLFVAVGYGGSFRIATSSDGISWTGRTTSVFPTYGYGVSYSSNGTWIATGTGNPNVGYSTDGTNWTGVNIASMTNGYGTAYLSNTYLVCGTAGGVFTSANLSSWTNAAIGTAFAIQANSNTALVAGGGATATFFRSINGTTFSSVPLSSAPFFTNSVQGVCHVP